MAYRIVTLQNSPSKEEPTIKIVLGDLEWQDAYKNWIAGENPTDSLEWKKGVFAITTDLPCWCGRCGVARVKQKGSTCEPCRASLIRTQEMWKRLKCSTCGKQAIGYHIFGAFCSDEHYMPPKDKKIPLNEDTD